MTEESYTEKQLFDMLISQSVYGVWIALGKMKNPVTDKIETNMDQATYYIELLEMVQLKTEGNLSEYEDQMLINVISELKMSFLLKKT